MTYKNASHGNIFRYLAILSGLLAGISVASAQDVDCSDPQVQMEMTYCAEMAWEAADGDLNYAYQMARRYMNSLDEDLPDDLKGAAETLRDAQRAWIAFRDKACEAEGYQARGGTMESMLVYSCYERMTRARTEDLRAMAEEN